MILSLILLPSLAGLAAFFIRNDPARRVLILAASTAHFILTCAACAKIPSFAGCWLGLDNTAVIFLAVTSLLFLGASTYAVKYLRNEKAALTINSGENIFSGCFLFLLAAMTTVIVSRHLAVLWAAVEATTLASAPLIYFHKAKRSLEATWKYLLICSVGIALALLGVFFLAAASIGVSRELVLDDMIANAGALNIPWLKAAFLLLFAGYGTKMGLAPFHTWLPDAHSEAPSVVSALLSGALLNCAFLGILRAYQICAAAGIGGYCREVFLFFGLLSLVFAAFFILSQSDYKRMLAYSSIEHMGILALGVGLGAGALPGVIINVVSHSLTKSGLFFLAGNILAHYGSKNISDVKGLMRSEMRLTGIFWFVGFLLITGMPPSGIFLGKFIIIKESLLGGHYLPVIVLLTALAAIFAGMAKIFISMSQNTEVENYLPSKPIILPSAVFFILVFFAGIYLPEWLLDLIEAAARELGGV